MDKLLEQFLIEGAELVQRACEDLVELEKRPDDAGLIDSAFRAVHTLKGSVGLFELPVLAEVLHLAEDLLGEARAGRVAIDSDMIDGLLGAMDLTEAWLGDLAATGAAPAGAAERAEPLLNRLRAQLSQDASGDIPVIRDESWALELRRRAPNAEALTAIRYAPDVQAYFRGDDPLAIALATPGLEHVEVVLTPGDEKEPYDPYQCRTVFQLLSSAGAEELAQAFRFVRDEATIVAPNASESPETASRAVVSGATAASLRIDGRRVDALADLVDELVVAKTALLEISSEDAALRNAQAAIERLTNALYHGVMTLRMTPVAPVLRRLERQARDIASGLGKPVEIDFRGHSVEADKAVVDGLYEPLLHLIRNSLDHGIEDEPSRTAAGKGARARLAISILADGDDLLVEVSDDGRGFDPDALRRTAVARGLLDQDAANALTEAEARDLIFAPGFSTAAAVTAVSGRGVGMDAVRTGVQVLGGRLTLGGETGQGAIVAMRLPLTVVMTRVLIVEAADECFAVPLDSVRETLQLPRERVSPVRLGEAFVLRDETLPLLHLGDLLDLEQAPDGRAALTVLVAEAGDQVVGIAVDRILGRQDIVMRPLTGLLAAAPGALGTTLLGDGRLMMVLDLGELAG